MKPKKGKAPNKNANLKAVLFDKTGELIREAAKQCNQKDSAWATVYLNSALSLLRAIRELE